ncbi:uncharacterized protein Z518_04931 [Rhinocladiella mackenziei CBS 650.93]|uniref:Thiamine-triphosphatase n=1 Tax=Rhinocladiella mackenziei CBS 650.93 TaxID=1442369 RepID=A0A0D2JCV5_9EURO|nr:uncharacterized protein Z518_04931 [Rhinocladiella mackenziei CBS 650.93]KIX06955.1 hypothetical protein Z518_04931 [Rhinocladiella mackenziei CBS 650.93]
MKYPTAIRLEVERKFTSLKCHPLRVDGGKPPFLSLRTLGKQDFHDVYYDYEDRLSRAGTWLRQRNGRWQSKVRRGGTYTNSQFEESSDLETISTHIRALTGLDIPASQSFGLSRIASLTTFRQGWIADEEFKIVFDRTDFGHQVGEVELEKEVIEPNEQEIRKILEKMDHEIADFLRRYNWAFSEGEPVGKLSAYFAQGHSEGPSRH